MASQNISTAFIKQYGSTLDLLLQLKGGQFDDKCLLDTDVGEEKYYDQLGAVNANEVTDRYGDSPLNDISHERRRITATPYDVGLMLDRFDKVQMLINPESEYVSQQIAALRRKKTIEFLKGALGTAYSGKGGGIANELPASQFVPVDTGSTASTGFNLEKIRVARRVLELNNVDLEDPMNTAYIAWGPREKHELLGEEKATSADYAAVKALVNGDIDTFYGFKFVTSNQLPFVNGAGTGINLDWTDTDYAIDTDTTDVRACFAWVKSGMRTLVNPSIQTEIEKRGDKRFNWYSYACMRAGSLRMEEEKVVVIPSDESPV